jgi:hypothetical protein
MNELPPAPEHPIGAIAKFYENLVKIREDTIKAPIFDSVLVKNLDFLRIVLR